MTTKFHHLKTRFDSACVRTWLFLSEPVPRKSEKGEGIASYAAIIAIALVIIIAVMALFRDAVTAAFRRIGDLLTGI